MRARQRGRALAARAFARIVPGLDTPLPAP